MTRDFFSNLLERYIFLMSLQDQNETLFYRTVLSDLQSYMPIIYTPTVGEAALQYGAIFRNPRGLYVTAHDRGRVREVLRNWTGDTPRVIVATDGGRILGLGDLGANGMSISVGKLALYTAAGGIHPGSTLPIVIDVGTNTERLLSSPHYLGLRQKRIEGDAYLDLMDEFVEAVSEVFPDAMLQFEDFATENAVAHLARYRDRISTFNDDILSEVSTRWRKTARQKINIRLADKPSGCVVWVRFDPVTLKLTEFLWFGALPGESLPDLGDRIGKHEKGDQYGHKAQRAAIRVINKGRFELVPSMPDLVDRLFEPNLT